MRAQFKQLTILGIFWCLLCLAFTRVHGQSAPLKVSDIRIYGNKITDDEIVLLFLGIDTGVVFDSVSTMDAQNRLHQSGLFSSARVFSQAVPEGIRLLVILEEKLYLSINDIGGELYSSLYGRPQDWWRARFGLTFENFRGRMEQLSVHLSFWTSRSLGLSWYKTFYGTPYFLKTGFSLSHKPYTQNAYDRFAIQQYTTFGRRLGSKSMIYASLIPTWFKDEVADINADSIHRISTEPVSELLFVTGFSTDHRDHKFNTHSGTYFRTSILTNYPYSSDVGNSYVQLSTENRLFHRGIWPKHTVGYRLRTTLRNEDAGLYNHLYAGGESSVRGYGSNWVGSGLGANNRVLVSGEYRFPLFKTPTIDLLMLKKFDSRLRGFYYQVDGAFFCDYAYLWRELEKPRENRQDASGVGLGIRVLAPTIKRSVSFDVAWPVENLIGHNKHWKPGWHLYLDLPF